MSAPWVTQRRPQGAPPAISLHPKPVISVEEWETNAPLGDIQTRSVSSLKRFCEEHRLPLKFQTEVSLSRPSTPVSKPHGRALATPSSPSRPSTPTNQRNAHHSLHPKRPVQTPEQFHDWFSLIERSVAHSQEAHFRAHLESVSEHRATCESLLKTLHDVETEVAGMLDEWRGVEEGGRSLKDACERLLEEKDRLIETTDSISLRLEYFQELEHATRMLNHPGESLVLQTDFLLMVERVDVCLEYLEAHRHFREAEIYLLRYQQCLTRAMTLIKMYFVGSLKALSTDVQKRMSEGEVSETAQTHLLYSKFVTASFQVAPLLAELERRAAAHPDDLGSLLTECHSAYLGTRKSLLVGRLVEEIKGLDPVGSELVELTRAGCSYLRQLCVDEYDLYLRFFSTGEDRLYHYLESLCDYLYDDLRPRILHEPRLITLCEVCTILQALMILDIQPSTLSASTSVFDEDDVSSPSDERGVPRMGTGQLHIKHILQLVLQDAQTRLLFKAQAVVQSEVRFYVPKGDDLNYPDKLAQAKHSGLELTENGFESQSRLFSLPSPEKQSTWYPTLRKTLWLLSQLHDFVNPAIFDDIAQETIGLCRQSLKSAAELLSAKSPPESYVDAQLFLVRHLLILKDTTANLVLKERGPVHGMAETLGSMLRGTSVLFNSNKLLAGFAPTREENETNVKTDIDHNLKQACEELISQCADVASQPVRTFLERSTAFLVTRDGSTPSQTQLSQHSHSLSSQDFASIEKVRQVDSDFRTSCQREISVWLQRLKVYLEDSKTVSVLVSPMQTKIMELYSAFHDLVGREYPGEVADELLSPMEFWSLLHQLCVDNNVIVQ